MGHSVKLPLTSTERCVQAEGSEGAWRIWSYLQNRGRQKLKVTPGYGKAQLQQRSSKLSAARQFPQSNAIKMKGTPMENQKGGDSGSWHLPLNVYLVL